MRSPRWWLGIGGTVVVAALAGWAADTPTKPPTGPKSPSVPQRESGKSSGGGLGALKLPDGAIIVLTADAADIQQIPGAIVLKPEEFKKLREKIEQLQRQVNPDKPVPPSICRLRGSLDGDVVHIQAEFEFETEKPKARVALGCQKGWPTAAKLDDGSRLPLLSRTANEGYVIQVETPGKHKLILDLDVPVIAKEQKSAERGFELDLPGAALTRLEHFDVPAAVQELRIPGRDPILAKELSSKNPTPKALGPLDLLKVSWTSRLPQQQAEPVLEAFGQIKVDIDDAQITSDAELTLRTRSGPVDQWRLYLPPQTRLQGISVEAATIVPPADPIKLPVWTIQLTEPSDQPLRVNVHVQQSRPKPAANGAAPAVAIGPFTVVNAFRQNGAISVTAPTDVRLQFRPHGDVSQSDLLDDPRRESGGKLVAVFNYRNLAAPAKPDQPAPAPLDITIEPAKGAVESRLEHTFTLRADRTWQISTRIDIKPIRTAVDSFVVRLPPGYHYDREAGPSPADLVEEVVIPDAPEDQARDATVRLAQPRRSQLFSVTLVGTYSGPTQENQHVALPLPQVRGTLDRGGPVRASVPAGMEVKLQSADFKSQQAEPWQTDRNPERVDLAWRRYRPELIADIEVDVTLTERQARVSERIRFQSASGPMKQVSLRLADFPPGAIPKIDEGGTPEPFTGEIWPVALKTPGKEQTLAFSLSVALPPAHPEEGRSLAIPLAWPEEATRCTTKVRVFGDPSVQPLSMGEGAWSEEPKEVVPGKTVLPSLVLLGHGFKIPLKLRLSPSAMPLLPAVVVDRLLMQVAIAEGGYQTYRARFHISKLTHRELDLELPSSPASLNLSVLLNGTKLPNWNVVDEKGNVTETGRIIRFLDVEPALYEKGSILDVGYRIAPGRQEGNGRWHSTLYPPRLRSNASLGWVRWQIAVPAGWLPLSLEESFSTEEHWGWRGWLPGPRPAATTADLERWISSGLDSSQAANADSKTSSALDLNLGSADALVGWETSANALRVYHVPQRAWLLACSLTLLLFGLGLYFARLPRPFYWLVVLGVSLGAVLAGIWWPSVLPAAIYGCVPGALVLAAVVAFQWMVQREYRRRVVFMPGFTRLKPGSSLFRPGSSGRPRGEPSTVDQQPGSGQRALVPSQKAENNAP